MNEREHQARPVSGTGVPASWQRGYNLGLSLEDTGLHCGAASAFNFTLFAI